MKVGKGCIWMHVNVGRFVQGPARKGPGTAARIKAKLAAMFHKGERDSDLTIPYLYCQLMSIVHDTSAFHRFPGCVFKPVVWI